MKITAPLFSLSAQGNIARSLCFRRSPSGQKALKAYTPANPKTPAQNYAREIFAIGVSKAKLLTTAQKAALAALAAAHKNNPPNNIYLSLYLENVKLCMKYHWRKYHEAKYGNPQEWTV